VYVHLQPSAVEYVTGEGKGDIVDSSPLADWLIAECEKRHLSWSEASRKAGLSPNTISQIVGGTSAGTKRLAALADYFGVSREYLFRLAGLLEPLPPDEGFEEARLRASADELVRRWRLVHQYAPEQLDTLINIAYTQAVLVLSTAGVDTEHDEGEGEGMETKNTGKEVE